MQPEPTVVLPSERVPVLDEADVIVIGGGTSGFLAATAAARTGAKTILVERLNYLGGCTTTTYNTTIGAFYNASKQQVIAGLGWEFVERMQREGEAFVFPGQAPQLWPPTTKKIALDMVEEAGVRVYFYTWASGVLLDGQTITGLVVQTKAGRSVIWGKTFVDASGDADIAVFAGAPVEIPPFEHTQQISVDYLACGVDFQRVAAWAREHRYDLLGASGIDIEEKPYGPQPMLSFTIPGPETRINDEGTLVHTGVMPTVKLLVYREAVRIQGNADVDPLDPRALSQAEAMGLRGALKHLQYLRETVPGFEGAFVAAQNHLGVRESRQIVGDYRLTIDDLRSNARFADVIALNCRPLDYHLHGTVFQIEFLSGHHDIPYRALVPQGVDNLLAAGRCISCDHLSQASLRGAATCMATGHAAGTAAALAAKASGRVREIDIAHLQDRLKQQGAILDV